MSKSNAKRVIVIGPSHHYYFKGMSASYYEKYQSPCGNLDIDTEYLIKIAKDNNIGFEPKAHKKEHSTEVQVPFIKHYLPNTKIIELVYGDINYKDISKIINYILKENNLNSYLLDYRTSFDYSGDDKRVVGYMSAILY